MATIGTFTAADDGYTGLVKTLNLRAEHVHVHEGGQAIVGAIKSKQKGHGCAAAAPPPKGFELHYNDISL